MAAQSSGQLEETSTSYTVALFRKEKLILSKRLELNTNSVDSTQPLPVQLNIFETNNNNEYSALYGVLRVTVFDSIGNPLAERLVFRRPPKPSTSPLSLQVTPVLSLTSGMHVGQEEYIYRTGDQVELAIKGILSEGSQEQVVFAVTVTVLLI